MFKYYKLIDEIFISKTNATDKTISCEILHKFEISLNNIKNPCKVLTYYLKSEQIGNK